MDLYHTTDLEGISILNPNEEQMEMVLMSLETNDADDAPHPDVALTHDGSGWSLSVYASGVITFDNLDASEGSLRYMDSMNLDTALELWLKLARGNIEGLLKLDWKLRG